MKKLNIILGIWAILLLTLSSVKSRDKQIQCTNTAKAFINFSYACGIVTNTLVTQATIKNITKYCFCLVKKYTVETLATRSCEYYIKDVNTLFAIDERDKLCYSVRLW